MTKIIFQGAEGIIKINKNIVTKDRVKKSYRLEELDNKIRKQRTKKEIRLLQKASKAIYVPKVISSSDFKIDLEFIKGKKLSDNLDKLKNSENICKKIGENIAKLHDLDIIHGDLTTSNMVLSKSEVYFIDFGLGFESNRIEDKAVDLHLIKQALEAKHFRNFKEYFKNVLMGYKISKNSLAILNQLEKVERRGRYKDKY